MHTPPLTFSTDYIYIYIYIYIYKSLKNVSNTSLNLCHEELRQFWRQKRVQPVTSKVYLIKWPVCVYIYTLYIYTGWTLFCLQNCLNSSWHRFNEVLETFFWDFGPYWHESITQLLQICRLHIHDVNLPFHHIPKVLYWIEIWWLWRPFE